MGTRARGDFPPWQRSHVRVLAALILQGVVSVAAAAYLVLLAVSFFDARLTRALGEAQDVAEAVRPFYRAQMDAKAEALRARAELLARELARASDLGAAADRLPEVQREDVVHLAVLDRQGEVLRQVSLREDLPPDAPVFAARVPWRGLDPPEVPVGGPPEAPPGATAQPSPAPDSAHEAPSAAPPGRPARELEVTFALDPSLEARFQAIGRKHRTLVAQRTSLDEIEAGVMRAVFLLSGFVLLLALVLGLTLARSTTRKVAALTAAMARIARGERDVRVPDLGRDELGQLGASLNEMLDTLDAAQAKVAYLERVGAWQGMARRLAHEIKNPLTPIVLAVQQIRDKDPGTNARFSRMLRTSVELVEGEIEALRRMVATFSRFAKLPEVQPEPERLARILAEFERAYGHLTDRPEDTLVVDVPTADVLVRADRALLKQALVNLVENAVGVGRERGSPAVRVHVHTEVDPARGLARILVDDNGPGIPPDERELVFEPYVTGREHGTGLGLAIVRKVALGHGGDVWIEASPEGGARFVLTVPLAEAAEPPGDQPSSSASRGER